MTTKIYTGIHFVGKGLPHSYYNHEIYLIVYLYRHRHGTYVQFEMLDTTGEQSHMIRGATLVVYLQEVKEYAPGWSTEKVVKTAETIRRWGNNHLRTICPHMKAFFALTENPPEYGIKCDVCHYVYGVSHYLEPIPEEVLDFLKGLPGKRDDWPH